MDTNQIAELVRELQAAKGSQINWNIIIPSFIGFLGVAVGTLMTFKMAQLTEASKLAVLAAETAKNLAAKAAAVAEETGVTTKEIHKAVNSEREAMLEKLQALRLEILGISKDNQFLEDKLMDKEFEKRVAEGVVKADKSREKVVVVLPPEPTPVVIPPAEPTAPTPALAKPPITPTPTKS